MFALISRLQIEHVNSNCAESDQGLSKQKDLGLMMAFRSLRFLSASEILFASNCVAPMLNRQRHFVRSCAAYSEDSVRMLKYLNDNLRVSLQRFFGHLESAFLPEVLHRKLFWQSLIRHSCNMASPS